MDWMDGAREEEEALQLRDAVRSMYCIEPRARALVEAQAEGAYGADEQLLEPSVSGTGSRFPSAIVVLAG